MEGVATVLPSCLSGTMSPLNPQLALCQCCGHEGSPGACSVFLLSMLNSSCGDRGACPVNTWVEQWLHFTRDYLSYTPALPGWERYLLGIWWAMNSGSC